MGHLPRRLLVDALVLAAGGAAGPLASQPLARLVDAMGGAGRLARAVTLAGARIEDRGASLYISQAPPRRSNLAPYWGFAMGVGPALARAASLLADPKLAAIGI